MYPLPLESFSHLPPLSTPLGSYRAEWGFLGMPPLMLTVCTLLFPALTLSQPSLHWEHWVLEPSALPTPLALAFWVLVLSPCNAPGQGFREGGLNCIKDRTYMSSLFPSFISFSPPSLPAYFSPSFPSVFLPSKSFFFLIFFSLVRVFKWLVDTGKAQNRIDRDLGSLSGGLICVLEEMSLLNMC